MSEAKELSLEARIAEVVDRASLVLLTLFDPKDKSADALSKVAVRPIKLKNRLHYQFEFYRGKKVTHKNVLPAELAAQVVELVGPSQFRRGRLTSRSHETDLAVDNAGSIAFKTKATANKALVLEHNRKKAYLIPEGEPCDFLERLGVMTKSGEVVASKYHKFRQINRFLEMVADTIPHLDATRELQVVDFGCGKSYLTFALYHYLTAKKGMAVRIVGLDLKADVIAHCQQIADDLQYAGLSFVQGEVKGFERLEAVDMVVTLHACDTATDDALAKAIGWKARVILSVPCCQHELFSKIQNPNLQPMLKHGIIKERLSALVTDSLRAQLLQALDYDVQMLEFIDLEHTSKNILIRAYRNEGQDRSAALAEYRAFRDYWGIQPYIESVLPPLTIKLGAP